MGLGDLERRAANGARRLAARQVRDAVLAEQVAADERRGGARHRVEADGALLGLLLLGLGLGSWGGSGS